MGKSPGKWIKSVLFGKKSAKSSYPKNAASEKRTSFVSNATTVESTLEYPGNSDLTHEARNQKNGSTDLDNGSSTNLARDAVDILPGDQGTIIEAAGILSSAEQTDIVKLEQAATRAQAVFRGYLARRAFRALKGIIRLQALIRGHLVRRQAVATLRCIQAIVKFQVLIRDHQVEILDSLPEEPKGLDLSGIDSVYISEKFSRNGYFIKLIQSGPSMPLVLQYEEAEPNSVWSWLQRWSVCRFWEPPKGLKKGVESKHQKKQRSTPTIERESWRSKRTNQKASLSNGDSTISHSSTDHEKSKRHQKKTLVVSQSESTQEHPQSELERVKRNLRKVSLSAEEALEKSESANEKPQRRKTTSTPAPPEASQNGTENAPAAEKKNEITLPAPEQTPVEPAPPTEPLEAVESPMEGVESIEKQQIDEGGEVVPSKPLDVVELPTEPLTEEPDELIDDEPTTEQPLSETDNNVADGSPKLNEEPQLKEDQNKENQKTRRRRSLPGKQEPSPTSLENVSQNIPTTLPSYMAATESAKAKLRAQGLAKAAAASQQDAAVAAVENNGFVRRHSLPSSSTNGKISSLSPRVQRPTNLSNGKATTRTDRSLMSSRDDKQVQQPGWRR